MKPSKLDFNLKIPVMNVLWVFAVVTGSTGLVDRPITAGQGNACSSGEDQIKHVGVMIEVFAEEPHVHTMFQAICLAFRHANLTSADPRKSAFFVQALTCVERVPNIAVYRENNLVCEAVDYVKVVSVFETN